jgi:hypothetical protein
VGIDFDFGLGESCFVFVGYDHFHEGFFRMRGHEWPYHIGRERLHGFYGRSIIRNDFRKDEHGTFVNNGIGRERLEHIAQATHHPLEKASFEERHPVGDRKALEVTRSHQIGQQFAKPGGQVHGQPGKPGGQSPSPASVNKVFRPPTPAPSKNQGQVSQEKPKK